MINYIEWVLHSTWNIVHFMLQLTLRYLDINIDYHQINISDSYQSIWITNCNGGSIPKRWAGHVRVRWYRLSRARDDFEFCWWEWSRRLYHVVSKLTVLSPCVLHLLVQFILLIKFWKSLRNLPTLLHFSQVIWMHFWALCTGLLVIYKLQEGLYNF